MTIEELASRCIDGDKEAFGRLYQATFPTMRKVVLRYVQNQETADDILHDGYIIAMTSIKSLKDPSKVASWLASIMKNLAIKELQSPEYIRNSTALEDVAEDMPESGNSDDDATQLTQDELEKLIGDLPEGYGKVFRLSVLEGLSHKEIAQQLGIAPNSSSSQISHAKAMLRRLITNKREKLGILLILAIGTWTLLNLWNKTRHDEKPRIASVTSGKIQTSKDTSVAIDNNSSETKQSVINNRKETAHARYASESVGINIQDANRDDILKEIHKEMTFGSESSPEHTSTKQSDSLPVRNINTDYSIENLIAQNEDFMRKTDSTGKKLISTQSFAVGCAGNIPITSLSGNTGPGELMAPPDLEMTRAVHHKPLSFGIYVQKSIMPKLALESGIRYTYLSSDLHKWSVLQEYGYKLQQSIHYIGIPVKLNYRFADFGRFSIYGQIGGALDIPVYGTQTPAGYHTSTENASFGEKRRINPPLQWSVEGGVGIQYRLLPNVSIYAEPSLRYNIGTDSPIKTIHSDEPFEITIPIGVRFSW